MSKRKNRLINQFHNLSIFKKLFNYLIIKFRSFIVKLLNWSLKINGEASPIRLILFLLFVPLLLLLISLLRKFFDASRMEQLARYFSSREGQMMVRVYVGLVIAALVVTFPKQTRKIINLTIFSFQSIFKLIAKFLKFIAFIAKLVIRKLNNLRRRRLFRHNHKRKTE